MQEWQKEILEKEGFNNKIKTEKVMQEFRIMYVKDGLEIIAPFIFSNIGEARDARSKYIMSGKLNVAILVRRAEDNKPNTL